MDEANVVDRLETLCPPADRLDSPCPPQMREQAVGREQVGASSGLNLSPGSDDDGWKVPPLVALRDGSIIQLDKDGEALHAGFEAIKLARQRICLEMYIFASDDTGRAFAELLTRKARDGLRVYVIYDSFGSMSSDPAMFNQMRRAGVRLEEFHPLNPWKCRYSWRPLNRDHRKLLIVDHQFAVMGGLNLGAQYAGSWIVDSGADHNDFWRDTAIGVRGPATIQLLRAFAHTWKYVTHGGPSRRAELVHNVDDGDYGVLASVPSLNSPLVPLLKRLFRAAQESILLTIAYFAPSDELIDELCRASRRGVRVRLMLPGRCDVNLLMVAARSFYEKLMNNGVEIYERSGVVLHAKTMVMDQRISIVGSANLDYRSIEYNLELSSIIRSETFGRQMGELFENDVKYAVRIDLKEWRRRPMYDRFVQWAVSRTRYLL